MRKYFRFCANIEKGEKLNSDDVLFYLFGTIDIERTKNAAVIQPNESTPVSATSNDNRETMNDELAKVLKLYREKSHNWDIHKTPEIFIQPTSSPASVKQWLKAKGFSEYVVTKFGYLNGHELFSLDRETLEDHCGVEEGRRLLSQITVQRNVSGVRFKNLQ